MAMKSIYALLGTVLLVLTLSSVGFAQKVYFEGEGFIQPSPKSLEPLKPQFGLAERSAVISASGETVSLNVLATNFPDIILYVTVLDSGGNPIPGLTKNDFTVTEQSETEGSPTTETITSFSESTGPGSGINVSLVFDVSGSMSGSRLADAKTAAINFVNSCTCADRANLVKFSSCGSDTIVMASNFICVDNDQNSTYDIIDAINSLSAGGNTAVYDGTGKGIESLSQEAQPKAVIVFSDGSTNNDCKYSINDVIAKANNDGVPVYTIGLGIDPQNLKDIANQTGAFYRYAPSALDMEDIYKDIAKNLQNQYTIGYRTHNPAYDGTTRTVRVTYNGATGTGIYVVNYKPVITLDPATLELSNKSQLPNIALSISGIVKDLDAQTQGQTLTASLFYRHVEDPPLSYTQIALSLSYQGNGVYRFSEDIPGSIVQDPGVEYYLYATDSVQETYSPFNYNDVPYSIPVEPNCAPIITHTVITSAPENQPLDVSAHVIDPNAGDYVSGVALFYRTHDPNQITPYYILYMTHTGNDNYTAQIPANIMRDPGVDYFISAWDSFHVRADHGTSTNPHFISIGSSISYRINLIKGFNLIGYCSSMLPVAQALNSIDGKYESVWGFVNGSWKFYDPAHPEFSDLENMEPCYGYWVNATVACILILP